MGQLIAPNRAFFKYTPEFQLGHPEPELLDFREASEFISQRRGV